ncbi:hypothetical protein EDB85DRAFT_585146 [Lactarius pseudohatsudake]|nr:hypothetical protein EDB85DRAFT_585146 [Lactarius pseudohatsudake]
MSNGPSKYVRLVSLLCECTRLRLGRVFSSAHLPAFPIPNSQLSNSLQDSLSGNPRFPISTYWTMAPKSSITDMIDGYIADLQNVLSRHPRSHSIHIMGVYALAVTRSARYNLSQQKEDLNKSVLHYIEAILLLPVSRGGHSLNIVKLLFGLARTLLYRSEKLEQPEDVKYSIEYLHYLRGLPLDSFDLPRHTVTTSLIQALGNQVMSEAGDDGTQNVNEMVDLCRELLDPNISADFLVAAIWSLGGAVTTACSRVRSVQLLDKAIECLRDAARVCTPGSHLVLYALAHTLFTRFMETHSNDDYEEATAQLEIILDPNQLGECPDSAQNLALCLAGTLVFVRSTIYENPEYSEVTISRLRTLLSSFSDDREMRLYLTDILATKTRERFTHYSLSESLEEANSYTSQLVDISSSQGLEKYESLELSVGAMVQRSYYSMERTRDKIQHLEELLLITPPGTPHHKRLLSELGEWYKSKYYHNNDISDLEESIKYSRLSLDATHSRDQWRVLPLASLRNVLLLAFEKTSKIDYLDQSIAIGYNILELKSVQFIHFHAIRTLVSSLLTRGRLPGRREDRLEAIQLMSLAVDNQYAREPDRFRLSCRWAIVARNTSHPTTLTAYKSAISLMERSLSFAPTVSIQHARLVAMGKNCQTMPLDYVSFQIKLGRFEEAVETLEQGRALLWSEMRGLRTPMARLIEEDSRLAKRFANINQELEALTTSITPSGSLAMEDWRCSGW